MNFDSENDKTDLNASKNAGADVAAAKVFVQTFGNYDILVNGASVLSPGLRHQGFLRLFVFFILNRDKVFSPSAIIEKVWPNKDYHDNDAVVRTQIFRLKKRLSELAPQIDYRLEFMHGGYYFSLENSEMTVDADLFVKLYDLIVSEASDDPFGLPLTRFSNRRQPFGRRSSERDVKKGTGAVSSLFSYSRSGYKSENKDDSKDSLYDAAAWRYDDESSGKESLIKSVFISPTQSLSHGGGAGDVSSTLRSASSSASGIRQGKAAYDPDSVAEAKRAAKAAVSAALPGAVMSGRGQKLDRSGRVSRESLADGAATSRTPAVSRSYIAERNARNSVFVTSSVMRGGGADDATNAASSIDGGTGYNYRGAEGMRGSMRVIGAEEGAGSARPPSRNAAAASRNAAVNIASNGGRTDRKTIGAGKIDDDDAEGVGSDARMREKSRAELTLRRCKEAFALYRDGFLRSDAFDGEWVAMHRLNYRRMWFRLVEIYVNISFGEERFDDVIEFCQHALQFEGSEEYIHEIYMDALQKAGYVSDAISHYESLLTSHKKNEAALGSARLKEIYRSALRDLDNKQLVDRSDIERFLFDLAGERGALICGKDDFLGHCRVVKEISDRTSCSAFICIVETISIESMGRVHKKLCDTEYLTPMFAKALRSSDALCAWNDKQILILIACERQLEVGGLLRRVLQEILVDNKDDPEVAGVLRGGVKRLPLSIRMLPFGADATKERARERELAND